MHVALAIYSRDDKNLEVVLEQARQSQSDLPNISVVYRMKFSELPEGRNPLGFKDGLHDPHVEGSGVDPFRLQCISKGRRVHHGLSR
jgi:hypothetical protein